MCSLKLTIRFFICSLDNITLTKPFEFLVKSYKQFCPQGKSGHEGLVPGHKESPLTRNKITQKWIKMFYKSSKSLIHTLGGKKNQALTI